MSAEASQLEISLLASEMGQAFARTDNYTDSFLAVLDEQIVAGFVRNDLTLFERHDIYSERWSTVAVDQVVDRRLAAAAKYAIETMAGIKRGHIWVDSSTEDTAPAEALSA